MNILLINHYAGSPEMGMEFRPYYFAREWVKMGHNVSIIAADYSHLRKSNPSIEKDFSLQNIDGIDYYWIKTNKYNGNGSKRAFTLFTFVLKIMAHARKLAKQLSPDVIICSSTYHLDHFAGQRIKTLTGKKTILVHEVHDMWPATLIEIGGMSRKHPFVQAVQYAEDRAYGLSDVVISMAPYTQDYMNQHGLATGKWFNIPLGIDLGEWDKRKSLSKEHKELISLLKNEGKFVVGYFGGHALSNALDTLIDSAKLCSRKKKDIAFVMVGQGVEKDRLIGRVRNEEIDNVFFLPPVDKTEIPELTYIFDCIYIGTFKNELYRFGLCLNKMLDAMMSGRPTVCSITAPPTWVDEADSGITVEAENPDLVVNALESMMSMTSEELAEMGSRGRMYAERNFDIKKLSGKMLSIFESFLLK